MMDPISIRWQGAGHAHTLDARLASGAGSSKVHAISTPWTPGDLRSSWDLAQGQRTYCGAKVPDDRSAGLIGLDAWEGTDRVTCQRCQKALKLVGS